MSGNRQQQGKYPLRDIVSPHEHDVLSGRGNFVNYHAGNEHFRALVRKHKVAYVACPKPQKGKFSRMIVDEIRSRNPPGRFLKQDPNTKLWHDIGEKKALDKTRQALREGAPDISKELTGEGGEEVGLGPASSMQNPVLNGPGNAGIYGLNDGLGGFGAPDLKSEVDDGLQVSQQAALSMMQQQQQRLQQQQQQLPRNLMSPPSQPTHPGQLYAGQMQRMQQQQQQRQQQQQQLRLQQQSLSKQLGGGHLGGHMGGIGALGGMGGLCGMGGIGVNPYANFQNDYDDLEPTPLDASGGDGGGGNLNARYNNNNQYGSQMTSNQQLQAQLHAQAQLQVQQQQLQQMQQRQHQQQTQLQNQGRSLAAHLGNNITTGTLKDGDGNSKKRPGYGRENSEQSLQLGNAFEDTIEHGLLDSGTGGSEKNKQKFGGSSNQLSIMSLTVSELGDADGGAVAGDLSSMFDSSLQISDKRQSTTSVGSSLNTSALDRRKSADEPSKAALLDMSVATIGNDMSSTVGGFGGYSSALGDVEDSNAQMSFSNMFDESEKNNL